MSAGRDYASLARRLAALDFPPIPLEGKAVRGEALLGWRRRLKPDLGWIAARVRGYLDSFWPAGLTTVPHMSATASRRP